MSTKETHEETEFAIGTDAPDLEDSDDASPIVGENPHSPSAQLTGDTTSSWVMAVRHIAEGMSAGDIDPVTGSGMGSTMPVPLMRRTPPRLVAMGFPDVPWQFLAFPLLSAISQSSTQAYGMSMSVVENLPEVLDRSMAAMVPDGRNRGGNLVVFLETSSYASVPAAVEVSRTIIGGRTMMTVESLTARYGMPTMLARAAKKGTLVMVDVPTIKGSRLRVGRLPSAVNAANASHENAPSWLGGTKAIGAEGDVSGCLSGAVTSRDWNLTDMGIAPDAPYLPDDDAVATQWGAHVTRAFDALAANMDDGLPASVPLMSRTPDALRHLGFPDAPWEHDREHILRECAPMAWRHDTENHGIPLDVMASIPELLCRPVAVYEPSTYPGHVNIVVDGATVYGQLVTVCVSLDGAWSGASMPVIRVSSIHGKGNALTKIDEAIGRGALFYIDKPAIRSLAKRCAAPFTERTMQTDGNPDGMRQLMRQVDDRHREFERQHVASACKASPNRGNGAGARPPRAMTTSRPDVDADGHITSTRGTIRLTVIR